MQIIRGLENLKRKYKNSVVTLGNFDGVHVGHQKIFKTVRLESVRNKGTSFVITFDPHPAKVIAPERSIRLLTPFDVKAELIEKFGIDVLVCVDFNREFSSMEADHFIEEVLINRIKAFHVIVGHNYRFGKEKKGTTELLRRRSVKYGFKFNVIRNARSSGQVVSSSRIRNLLLNGKVFDSYRLLGWPYFIQGIVIPGAGRGKKILDTPTANITTPSELVPKDGVYVVKIKFDDKLLNGVANIGKNPTFDEKEMHYEVHLFDFKGDLSGKNLRIYFIERLRDEKKYARYKELKEQIRKDIIEAKRILAKRDRVNVYI